MSELFDPTLAILYDDYINFDACMSQDPQNDYFTNEDILSPGHSDASDSGSESAESDAEDAINSSEAPQELQANNVDTSGASQSGGGDAGVVPQENAEPGRPTTSSADAGFPDTNEDATLPTSWALVLPIQSLVDNSGTVMDGAMATGPLYDLFDWGAPADLVDDHTIELLSVPAFDFGPSVGFVDGVYPTAAPARPAFGDQIPNNIYHDVFDGDPFSNALTLDTLNGAPPPFQDGPGPNHQLFMPTLHSANPNGIDPCNPVQPGTCQRQTELPFVAPAPTYAQGSQSFFPGSSNFAAAWPSNPTARWTAAPYPTSAHAQTPVPPPELGYTMTTGPPVQGPRLQRPSDVAPTDHWCDFCGDTLRHGRDLVRHRRTYGHGLPQTFFHCGWPRCTHVCTRKDALGRHVRGMHERGEPAKKKVKR